MTVLAGVSAKGAPGVSLSMWALAHLWPRPAIAIEADESGGTWALRHGLTSEPGLASLAAVQTPLTHELASQHGYELNAGHFAVCAPREPQIVSAALNWLDDRVRAWPSDNDLLIDVGRLRPERAREHPAIRRADTLLCFAHPRAEELASLACLLEEVSTLSETLCAQIVLVGSTPYPPHESLEALAVLTADRIPLRLAGVVPDEPAGADEIIAGGRRGSKVATRWFGQLALELAAASAHRPVDVEGPSR